MLAPGHTMGTGTVAANTLSRPSFPSLSIFAAACESLLCDTGTRTPHSQLRHVSFVTLVVLLNVNLPHALSEQFADPT